MVGPGGDYYCDANFVNDNWWVQRVKRKQFRVNLDTLALKRCPVYGKCCSDDEGNNDDVEKVSWVWHLRGQRRDNQCRPSHLWLCPSQWLSKVYEVNPIIFNFPPVAMWLSKVYLVSNQPHHIHRHHFPRVGNMGYVNSQYVVVTIIPIFRYSTSTLDTKYKWSWIWR